MREREDFPSSPATVFNWIREWLVQNHSGTSNNWVNLKLAKLSHQFAATKSTQPTLSGAEQSEQSISSKSTQWYSHPSFPVPWFIYSPQTGGYWLPTLQTCIDQYLFSKEYCAKLKKLVYFVMGKKQGVNQTSGPSCQGRAVLHAKVQKYETAEIGQAGREMDLFYRKGGSNRRGSPKDPCAFPATPLSFLQHKPGPWLCSAEQFVVSPGAVRGEHCFSQSYAQQLMRPHLSTAAGQSKPSRTWGWNVHIYLIANKNQQ